MAANAGLMAGKRGVILGVANNRSIAWGIAKACREQGAEIGLTDGKDRERTCAATAHSAAAGGTRMAKW